MSSTRKNGYEPLPAAFPAFTLRGLSMFHDGPTSRRYWMSHASAMRRTSASLIADDWLMNVMPMAPPSCREEESVARRC